MRAGWPAWEGSEFENYVIIWSVYCAEKLYTNLVKPVRHHFTVSSSKIGKTLVFITNCTAVSHTHTHSYIFIFPFIWWDCRSPRWLTFLHNFIQMHRVAAWTPVLSMMYTFILKCLSVRSTTFKRKLIFPLAEIHIWWCGSVAGLLRCSTCMHEKTPA